MLTLVSPVARKRTVHSVSPSQIIKWTGHMPLTFSDLISPLGSMAYILIVEILAIMAGPKSIQGI